MQCDEAKAASLAVAEQWYESNRKPSGSVNTNVMASGLAIAELLRACFPLTEESIKSEKNSQVKGLSGKLIKDLLARHGEKRKFTSEGGRTSRGTLVIATRFALALSDALSPFAPSEEERAAIADALQTYFVKRIQIDYFDKKRIEVNLDASKPVSAVVADIMNAAKERADQPTGIVAQHLVGAKLELRFPELEVGRDKANAADLQTERQGDFQLGNTAFHVTVAPSSKLVDRAQENILQGFRPIMLVPYSEVAFATGLFKSEELDSKVGVQSIESFVGTNIEEMSFYASDDIRIGLARLIRRYNERIADCEIDQSLRIEEPAWIVNILDVDYQSVNMKAAEDEEVEEQRRL